MFAFRIYIEVAIGHASDCGLKLHALQFFAIVRSMPFVSDRIACALIHSRGCPSAVFVCAVITLGSFRVWLFAGA